MRLFTIFLLVACAALATASTVNGAAEKHPVKQGAELLKTDIMGVFAHPDDETGVAATLAMYSLAGQKVVANVYCTRGEGGGNMVGTQWGAALGALREAELRDCLALLGVRYCYFLDQQDFFYTESAAATFQKWGREQTLERLVRLVRALRPDVIITMNPTPTPGQHGHHQAAGILAVEAFDAAADPARFPDQLKKEGLGVWQPRKLYFGGGEPGHATIITVSDALPGGKTPAQLAALAAANHRSQGFGGFANFSRMQRTQSLTLARSVVPSADSETDLLRGVPPADAQIKNVPPPLPASNGHPLSIEFVPRPAIASFRQWAAAHGVEHLSEKLITDIPVVAGEANDIRLEIRNSGAEMKSGEINLAAAKDWQAEPASLKYQVEPGQTQMLQLRLTPPATALKDAEVTASAVFGTDTFKAVAKAHPVPFAKIARLKSSPAMVGTDAGWAGVPSHEIPPTNVAEGHVKDAADSSARFRLAHDGKTLFVDVDVTDDVVVSNIAPNDIRGHWRSDSVEICIDPAGRAEHTLGCFKVGIFPFDTTGVVRAARDADANQGPIEETAPSMRVISRRTPTGYRIQAAIPFAEFGLPSVDGKRLGFNVIVYDGDKANAAIGENINKSRIAWSPRPGVQGRPEDWGRIEFE